MNAHLLHDVAEPTLGDAAPSDGDADLVRDLGLDDVVTGMAAGDAFVREVALAVLLRPLTRGEDIAWRQAVLADVRAHPEPARELYRIASEATEARVRGWWISDEPSSVLGRSVAVMRAVLPSLRALHRWATTHGGSFRSEGMRALVAEVTATLSDSWFAVVERHLDMLGSPNVVLTARIGATGGGTGYVLHRLEPARRGWLGHQRPDNSTIAVPETDTAGGQALTELRERGLAPVADVLAQAAEQVLGFLAQLRREVAFHVGCVALEERLRALGLPVSVPEPLGRGLTAQGLYDVGLAVRSGRAVVGNDVAADGATTIVITGANQGGKSTLLRAIGLAQVMMQAGMGVGAESFGAGVGRVHTHFRREEDDALRSGKLHEELARMSRIVDRAAPGDLVLSNESFASTNEREGSRIARQLVDGLVEGGLRVVMVTHLHEFARGLADEGRDDVLFLRAERAEDGARTFRVVPGAPLPTSFGADLWERVFGER